MAERYIRVSDVNTFMFCRRALHLQQRGVPSALVRERERGTAMHREYGLLMRRPRRNRAVAVALAAIAAALLVMALMVGLGW